MACLLIGLPRLKYTTTAGHVSILLYLHPALDSTLAPAIVVSIPISSVSVCVTRLTAPRVNRSNRPCPDSFKSHNGIRCAAHSMRCLARES